MENDSRAYAQKFTQIRQYFSPLSLTIFLEIFGVFFVSVGFIPRESILFLVGIFIFFVLFAPVKQAVLFSLFSIPLYTALPIASSFDSMASWRIIFAILAFRIAAPGFTKRRFEISKWIAKYPFSLRNHPTTRLGTLTGVLLGIGTLSLLVAQEPVFGIKKFLYLVNIFAVFFIVKAIVRNRTDFAMVLKYIFAGSLTALLVGYIQFIATLHAPLFVFWQWWAKSVIPVFYGENLGNLLSYSNTWFSYYKNADATLRMFATFPDSHSFALFMVLSLPIALTFFVLRSGSAPMRILFGATAALLFLSVILSGTRGIWVGAAFTFLSLITFFAISKRIRKGSVRVLGQTPVSRKIFYKQASIMMVFFRGSIARTSIAFFVVLILLFPVSSYLLKFSQMRQGGAVSNATFDRMSTSFSARELSNRGRIQIWRSTISSIKARPFLGVGIGNYPVVLGENVSSTKEGASAHSLYLDVASEMGIFAGMALIFIFLEILWRAIAVSVANRDVLIASFAGFFAVYLAWAMIYSAVDVVLLNDKVLLLFTALVGLLYVNFGQYSRV